MTNNSIFFSRTWSGLFLYLALSAMFVSFLVYIWFNSKQIVENVYEQHSISQLISSISNLRGYEHRYKLNGDLEQLALLTSGVEEIRNNIDRLNPSVTDQESKTMLVDMLEFTDDYYQSFEQFVNSDQRVVSNTIKFKDHSKKIEELALELATKNEEIYLVQGEKLEEYWSDFLQASEESKFLEEQLDEIDKINYSFDNDLLTENIHQNLLKISRSLKNISGRQKTYKHSPEILENSNIILELNQRLIILLTDFEIKDALNIKETTSMLNSLKDALQDRKTSIDKIETALRLRYYVSQPRQHRAKKITDYVYQLQIGVENINNDKSEFILKPTTKKKNLVFEKLRRLKLGAEDIKAELIDLDNKSSFEEILTVINSYVRGFSELVNHANLRVEADRSMVANLIKVRAFATMVGPQITIKIYNYKRKLSDTIVSSLFVFILILAALIFFIFIKRHNN